MWDTQPNREKLIKAFPGLSNTIFTITSKDDQQYNCIAWAAGLSYTRWWPIMQGGYYWPPEAPLTDTIEAFIRAFETLGYEKCTDGSLEIGYEKVAFYANNGTPTHAARQCENGAWTSKLGITGWDIIHQTAESIEGALYGHICAFVKKRSISD